MMRRRTLTLHLLSLALTFSIGQSTAKVAQYVCSQRTIELTEETGLVANDSNQNVQSAEETPANFFVDEDQLTLNDYTVERRIRKERTDAYEDPHNTRNWVDVSYVVVKKGDRVLAKFDAGSHIHSET
jgi:hypothetical protein